MKTEITFTDDELTNYLKGNYLVMTLMPIGFLSEKKIPIKNYAKYMGNKLAITWQRHKEAPLEKIAKLVGQNYIAGGAAKVYYTIEKNVLEIVIEEWPNPNFLQALEMTKDMVDEFNFVFEPIAKFLGMNYSFTATDNGYRLKFKK